MLKQIIITANLYLYMLKFRITWQLEPKFNREKHTFNLIQQLLVKLLLHDQAL